MAKESLYGISQELVFRETFNSEQDTINNGGVPTNVIFEDGVGTFGLSSKIKYPSRKTNNPISVRLKVMFTNDDIKTIISNSNALDFYIEINNNLSAITAKVGAFNEIFTLTSPVPVGQYVEIIFVMDSVIRAYVDTEETIGTPAILSFAWDTILSSFGGVGSECKCDLFEVYESALTKEEVKNLYENKRYRGIPPQQKEQLGPELHTNPNAVSDPSENETNTTTGFFVGNGLIQGNNVFKSQSTVVNVGDYAIEANANDTPAGNSYFYFDMNTITEAGKRYKLSFDIRHVGAGGDWTAYLGQTTGGNDNFLIGGFITSTDTTFQEFTFEWTHNDVTTRYLKIKENSATNDGGVHFDNFSVKEIVVNEHKEILNIDSRRGAIYDQYGNTITNTDVEIVRDGDIYNQRYNGITSKLNIGNVGNVKSICFWINPKSNTEKIIEGDTNNKLIYVNAGTLIYSDFTNAYIDGVDTDVIVANRWNFVTIYSNSDVAFNNMTIGLNNTTFGNMKLNQIRVYDGILSLTEHSQMYTSEKQYYGK